MIDLRLGDSREVLKTLEENSVDSCVTDPPYNLTSIVRRFGKEGSAESKEGTDGRFKRLSKGFMNQIWDGDGITFDPEFWIEVLRVVKPGGYLLSFCGTRNYHRMAVAIEDAGFIVKDTILWVYSSGFPKSLDISKQLDKRNGVERPVVMVSNNGSGAQPSKLNNHSKGDTGIGYMDGSGKVFDVTAPVTDDAKEWEGWGTALKPACEIICLAQKPMSEKTYAENVLKWGTGAINIDACRVEVEGGIPINRLESWSGFGQMKQPEYVQDMSMKGRWPANLIHDGSDEVEELLPDTKSKGHWIGGVRKEGGLFKFGLKEMEDRGYSNDQVSNASRFFYVAKPSVAEREMGLDDLESKPYAQSGGAINAIRRGEDEYNVESTLGINIIKKRKNIHCTVKPVALMRYLTRLVTRKGGIVLDPFLGSGTTGMASEMEGFSFIGIEREENYYEIAKRRIAATCLPMFQTEIVEDKGVAKIESESQPSLW